jgi:hypothetical protein
MKKENFPEMTQIVEKISAIDVLRVCSSCRGWTKASALRVLRAAVGLFILDSFLLRRAEQVA